MIAFIAKVLFIALISFFVSSITAHLYLKNFMELSRLLDRAYVDQMVEETLKIIKEEQRRLKE